MARNSFGQRAPVVGILGVLTALELDEAVALALTCALVEAYGDAPQAATLAELVCEVSIPHMVGQVPDEEGRGIAQIPLPEHGPVVP